MSPFVVNETMQDAADAAFARMIWWEATKLIAARVIEDWTPSASEAKSFAEQVTNDFKNKLESGFFDVNRKRGRNDE